MSATPPKQDVEPEGSNSENEKEVMDRPEGAQDQGGYEFEVKEQDRWLPIANVARIMKSALPENAKIAKEAKECMQECVSEFISFITSEASEKCQQEKRKTVNGEDILFAMTSLGFENYAEALKIYLTRYRENLLATQNRPGGGGAGGPSGAASTGNGNAAAPAAQSAYGQPDATGQLLAADLDAEGQDSGAFGYAVGHNGNGSADY